MVSFTDGSYENIHNACIEKLKKITKRNIEFISSKQYGKCPFRKTIHKIHTKEEGIGESFRETIQEEENFTDCLGFECMAFRYDKIEDIESIGCKRMNEQFVIIQENDSICRVNKKDG